MSRHLRAGLCVAAVLAAGGCRESRSLAAAAAPPASPPAVTGGETVVAEGAGTRITLAEVERRAAGRLARVRQEEYEIRRQALDELVAERLLEREASARGLTREALLKAEVADKLQAPSAKEVQEVYDRNKARLAGRTLEELRPHIEESLAQQARAERQAAFEQELKAKAKLRIALTEPRTQVTIPADAPALGPASAPVTFVEFLDYQCPYCHRAQEVVDRVLDQYQGKVRFVHRDFLLGNPRSLPAARAARCAGDQGRFWEYHRSLLTKPGDMGDEDLKARAASFGLDAAAFASCLASTRHDAAIEKSARDGQELGISGTPTFFVNGRRLVGVRPLEQFQQAIDAELAGAP